MATPEWLRGIHAKPSDKVVMQTPDAEARELKAAQSGGVDLSSPPVAGPPAPPVPAAPAPAPVAPVPELPASSPQDAIKEGIEIANALGLKNRGGRVRASTRAAQADAAEEIEGARQEQMDLLGETAQEGKDFSQDIEEIADQQAEELEAREIDRDIARTDMEMQREDLEEERGEAQEQASRNVDHSRFLGERSTEQKAGLIFAQVLSGIGQSLSGAVGQNVPNQAAQAIEAMVDRDVADQRSQIEAGLQKLEQIGAQDSQIYNDYKFRLADIDSMRQAALNAASIKMDQLGESLQSEKAANAALATAQTIRERSGTEAKAAADKQAKREGRGSKAASKFVEKYALERIKEGNKMQNAVTLERIKGANKMQDAVALERVKGAARLQVKQQEEARQIQVKGFQHDGQTYVSPAEAKEVRKQKGSVATARDGIRRLRAELKDANVFDLTSLMGLKTDRRRRIESLMNGTRIAAQAAIKGPASDQEAAMLQKQVGTDASFIDILTTGDAGLEEFDRTLESGLNANAAQFGYIPEAPRYRPKAAGGGR